MKKNLIIFFILVFIISLYLNLSYGRIYDRSETKLIRINWPEQISFKNPNFQNSIKYVALGDSLTRGVGSSNINDTLAFVFAQKLSQKMSVSLANLAVSGATTDDLISYQLDKAVKENPNYITLFIGTNDIHNLTSASKFDENMNYIINTLRKISSAKIIVFNIPYLGSKSLILFPYNLLLDYQIKQYNKILANLCENNNITLIDIYNPTKEKFSKQSNFYSSDNFHPSAEGYLLWGTLISTKDL